MRKLVRSLIPVLLTISLAACGSGIAAPADVATASATVATATITTMPPAAETATAAPQATVTSVPTPVGETYAEDDLDSDVADDVGATITLAGDTIRVEGDGEGIAVAGSQVTLTAAGSYTFSGRLDDGQIIVDTQDAGTVRLILDGVALTSTTGAPIVVANAEKTVITLAVNTENTIIDGESYVLADAETDEPNAAIFSHDDLTINGSGALTVNASYNHGIVSKDDLKITGGTITVNAVGDGLKGRDSIAVKDGFLVINAGGDGLQANNDTDPEEGYILIEGGTLQITSELDGIQAETRLHVTGGEIVVTAGGGSRRVGGTEASMKGLKAGVELAIFGGTLTIDAADDALHADVGLTIDGGTLALASGDDGVHADATVTVNGGDLSIAASYEGIESAIITINDGTIHLASNDDGINASSGGGGQMGGRPGPGAEAGDNALIINGGYIYVDAAGDGLDVNGPVQMTGGTVIVNGPTENFNGALDYSGSFAVTGGLLVAVGSSGMAQAPSIDSTQYAVLVNLPVMQSGGIPVHIASATGEVVLSFVPTKAYQTVVLSSAALLHGETYLVYTGGSTSGAAVDGLITDGDTTGGTQVATFTISDIITGAGAAGGFGAPGGRRRP